jgi:hypothetical protein
MIRFLVDTGWAADYLEGKEDAVQLPCSRFLPRRCQGIYQPVDRAGSICGSAAYRAAVGVFDRFAAGSYDIGNSNFWKRGTLWKGIRTAQARS